MKKLICLILSLALVMCFAACGETGTEYLRLLRRGGDAPEDAVFVPDIPAAVAYLVESLIPAVVGTVICFLPWPLLKEKRIIPASYIWMFLLMGACLITMLVLMQDEPETRRLFLLFFVQAVPAPVLLGCVTSAVCYYRYWQRHPASGAPARKLG